MKQIAIVNVTHELLAKLLKLPENCEVKEIIYGSGDRKYQTLRVVISSPVLPDVPEGTEIPWIDLGILKERSK